MMNNAGSIPPDFSIGSTNSMGVQCFDKLLESEIVVQLHNKTKIEWGKTSLEMEKILSVIPMIFRILSCGAR
jgi:hypothetical protein